ncbi:hypothetical protein NDU88_007657 [Pleurodeles waltl]|uniref:Uncharacterized protein n=1 Tax=Pleurodeles waltl TaxID=8319 RepID=A0AAV7RRK4_PLEWA|nr:hypothetical protein NDU88_007657 [Pleurodeles waltl]
MASGNTTMRKMVGVTGRAGAGDVELEARSARAFKARSVWEVWSSTGMGQRCAEDSQVQHYSEKRLVRGLQL